MIFSGSGVKSDSGSQKIYILIPKSLNYWILSPNLNILFSVKIFEKLVSFLLPLQEVPLLIITPLGASASENDAGTPGYNHWGHINNPLLWWAHSLVQHSVVQQTPSIAVGRLWKVVPLSNGMQVGIICCCYLRHLRCQLRKRCGSERGRYQHLLLFTPKMKNPFDDDDAELITSELNSFDKFVWEYIYIYMPPCWAGLGYRSI